jgi:hypothetical protein
MGSPITPSSVSISSEAPDRGQLHSGLFCFSNLSCFKVSQEPITTDSWTSSSECLGAGGIEWDLRICIANMSSDAAAGSGSTHRETPDARKVETSSRTASGASAGYGFNQGLSISLNGSSEG